MTNDSSSVKNSKRGQIVYRIDYAVASSRFKPDWIAWLNST